MADQERTEKATSRRRQKARDEGQFAYSQELTSAMTLVACLAAVFFFFRSPAGFRSFFSNLIEEVTTASNPEQILTGIIRQAGLYFLALAAPEFAAAVVGALAGNLLQGLPIFAPGATGFKWERLNPIQGPSRLKAKVSWMEWLKILFLFGVVTILVYNTFSTYWDQLITFPARSLDSSNSIIHSLLVRIVSYITVALAVLATADYFIQRWLFEQSIKQTKAEVKEDMKATEGNPAIKGKIKSIQRESARRRMMAKVKDADVIVANPTHYAVALEYKPVMMAAPRVVAKGRGFIAQRIKKLGREHDIPTVENVPLARALYRSVEVNHDIPIELYKAVAEVLAYVYKIRKRS